MKNRHSIRVGLIAMLKDEGKNTQIVTIIIQRAMIITSNLLYLSQCINHKCSLTIQAIQRMVNHSRAVVL